MDITELNKNKTLKQMKQTLTTKILQSSKQFNSFNSHNGNKQQFIRLLKADTDFISDSIKISWINDKQGRGIVATKNIKAGEILLREKYFAFGHPALKYKYYNNPNPFICEQFGDRMINGELRACSVETPLSERNLLCDMMRKYMNGSDVDRYKMSLLYDGSDRKQNRFIPSMDLFKYDELPQNVKNEDIPILSVRRISQIVEKVSFACSHENVISSQHSSNRPLGSAIFLLISFFNHNNEYEQNCECDSDNKNKIVYAIKDIKKGEELTISYYDNFTNVYPFNYNDP